MQLKSRGKNQNKEIEKNLTKLKKKTKDKDLISKINELRQNSKEVNLGSNNSNLDENSGQKLNEFWDNIIDVHKELALKAVDNGKKYDKAISKLESSLNNFYKISDNNLETIDDLGKSGDLREDLQAQYNLRDSELTRAKESKIDKNKDKSFNKTLVSSYFSKFKSLQEKNGTEFAEEVREFRDSLAPKEKISNIAFEANSKEGVPKKLNKNTINSLINHDFGKNQNQGMSEFSDKIIDLQVELNDKFAKKDPNKLDNLNLHVDELMSYKYDYLKRANKDWETKPRLKDNLVFTTGQNLAQKTSDFKQELETEISDNISQKHPKLNQNINRQFDNINLLFNKSDTLDNRKQLKNHYQNLGKKIQQITSKNSENDIQTQKDTKKSFASRLKPSPKNHASKERQNKFTGLINKLKDSIKLNALSHEKEKKQKQKSQSRQI